MLVRQSALPCIALGLRMHRTAVGIFSQFENGQSWSPGDVSVAADNGLAGRPGHLWQCQTIEQLDLSRQLGHR